MADGGTLKYYSGVKRKEVLTYTPQMNLQTPCQVKEASCIRNHVEWFYLYIMFTTGRARARARASVFVAKGWRERKRGSDR